MDASGCGLYFPYCRAGFDGGYIKNCSATHLHGQYSVKAPFHQQVKSNESEKKGGGAICSETLCREKREKKQEDERGEGWKAFSTLTVYCSVTTT